MADGVDRRTVLTGLAAFGAIGLGVRPAVAASAVAQPPIRPRADWAGGLPAPDLPQEAPGDVRFLLVHHTLTGNDYSTDSVPGQLRSIHGFHTSSEKGWPDIAYNFLIDAHGTIWEGRTGSLAGPVRGDATGGSQGFSQLCCFIGDHTRVPPTDAAQASMSALLAWLAGRYGIDLQAGPTITFTSRGSNRWPEGTAVTTDPVAGHRDMSQTACPGDACYPLVRGSLLTGAQALLPAPSPSSAPTQPPGDGAAPVDPSISPTESQADAAPTGAASGDQAAPVADPGDKDGPPIGLIAAAGGGTAALAGGALYLAGRRRNRDQSDNDSPPLDG